MNNLAELIAVFRDMLNSMWLRMIKVTEDTDENSLLDDWKQANWELIVESNLEGDAPIYLQPYGSGADFYGDSCRILRPEALPTHAVHCFSRHSVRDKLTGNSLNIPLDGFPVECFVAIRDGWYYEEPPFDHVLVLNEDQQLVIALEEVNLDLARVAD